MFNDQNKRGPAPPLPSPMYSMSLTMWAYCEHNSKKVECWQLHRVLTDRSPPCSQALIVLVLGAVIGPCISLWGCICKFQKDLASIMCYKNFATLKFAKWSPQNWHHGKPASLSAVGDRWCLTPWWELPRHCSNADSWPPWTSESWGHRNWPRDPADDCGAYYRRCSATG